MLVLWISVISITDLWIALIEEWISIKGFHFCLSTNVLFVACCSFLFSKDQAAWMVEPVRLSVCLSHLFNYSLHRIIMKFSGVIINDRGDVHAKGQDQRSKVNVTEVKTQPSRFRTITPVWIHIWWLNDTQSLIMLRRGALLIFKVICQISRSHG